MIPIAWVVTLLTVMAAVVLSQSDRTPFAARIYLSAFLLALALVGLLLGLRLSFAQYWAAHLQPLVAVTMSPLAYLGFTCLTCEQGSLPKMQLLRTLLLVLAAQLVMLIWWPISVDATVAFITLMYLLRIVWLLRRNDDDFMHVPPHGMRLLRASQIATVAFLGLMILSDTLTSITALVMGKAPDVRWLNGISGVFVMFIFMAMMVGLAMVLRQSQQRDAVAAKQDSGPAAATDLDRQLLARLDTLMNEQALYRDNLLTVARLGRRLGVPARDITNATNRGAGCNFSRYVNGYRIAHAQRLLRETDLPVTEVMLESGFLSKSSFNTEFRRITGQTPSQYRSTGSNR